MTTSRPGGSHVSLLCESAAFFLLGMVFERPRDGWSDQLRQLAAECAEPALAALANRASEEGAESDYLSLFGPGGLVSPREVAYCRAADPGHLIARLRLLYESFAYSPRTEETPDHVSVEVGFLGYLRLKEALVCYVADGRSVDVTQKAADLFVAEHLARLAVGLHRRLESAGDHYLRAAAEHLCLRLQPLPEDVQEGLEAQESPEDPLAICQGGCPVGRNETDPGAPKIHPFGRSSSNPDQGG